MPIQKSVLGKGLASLLPRETVVEAHQPPVFQKESSSKDRHPGISFVPISEIRVNPYQPRRTFLEESLQSLIQSIQEHGVIQPLVVRKSIDSGYELIAGERRFRAAQKLGLKQVPVVLRKTTDRESLELALVENLQRDDLNCIEEAQAYFQLMDQFSLTQEEVAKQVGKDRATVANSLRLLRLAPDMIAALRAKKISSGHGKVLLSIEALEIRSRLFQEILQNDWSVREAESWAERWKKTENLESKTAGGGGSLKVVDWDSPQKVFERRLQSLSRDLTRSWSLPIKLQGGPEKGKLMIQYHSLEELDRLISQMEAVSSLHLKKQESPHGL